MNPEHTRSSIIAQQCWRRWAASRTGNRAPCLYDDSQANIDTSKNKTTSPKTTATTNSTQQRSGSTAPRPPSSQRPTQLQHPARCSLTPQKVRTSILAPQCWHRWEASRTRDRASCLSDDRTYQHAQANIDEQQNNSNSNNNNDNDRHHTASQQYGTQATIVPTPNPDTTTQLARGSRSNDG